MSQDSIQGGEALQVKEAEQLKRDCRLIGRAREKFPRGGFKGLDNLELQVLVSIGALGPAGPTKVAELLSLENNTISHPIAQLALKGLIREQPDENDRRRKYLLLTGAGVKLAREHLSK